MRGIVVSALALMLSACMAATSERDGLPTGVTLLGSDDGYCDGPLEIEGDPDVLLDEGESTTVTVDDDDMEWQCMADGAGESGAIECPDDTDYVRITREDDESEFTLECFGS